ncbi:Spherulation-specific family 4-domain-containing protein [Aspergillus bertholletiae]|uniref:Spherulation-specific family 4-domain-containing protein n=1 Tax=Aspergillus bertholletiae TaxID=1226010 RepID=A0A5N7B677_9EURO|nr:Spherulation-specific family 4-domain-containing protein [Aspergillus bertholletiae]
MLSMNVLRVLSCLLLLFQVAQTAVIPLRRYDSDDQDDLANPGTESQTSEPSPSPTASSSSGGGDLAGSTEILIPYYAYPADGAWAPVEKLATDNPNVKFVIIINPNNGPGERTLPDENWRKAVPQLAAHSNVAILGYVATGYGGRDMSAVQRDIETYANWPTVSSDASFAVHGIFLDEAPAESDDKKVAFYKQAASLVKGNKGFGSKNTVIMNPGAVPDSAYLDIPDSTVIFESSYSQLKEVLAAKEFNRVKTVNKARLSSIVTSVPTGTDLSALVAQLRGFTGQIYLSNSASYLEYPPALDKMARILGSG